MLPSLLAAVHSIKIFWVCSAAIMWSGDQSSLKFSVRRPVICWNLSAADLHHRGDACSWPVQLHLVLDDDSTENDGDVTPTCT
jgi:hypothetical protein